MPISFHVTIATHRAILYKGIRIVKPSRPRNGCLQRGTRCFLVLHLRRLKVANKCAFETTALPVKGPMNRLGPFVSQGTRDKKLRCNNNKNEVSPVEAACSQSPLHHFRVGIRCKPLRAKLRQQTVEVYSLPSVGFEPSEKRVRYFNRLKKTEQGGRQETETDATSECFLYHKFAPRTRATIHRWSDLPVQEP